MYTHIHNTAIVDPKGVKGTSLRITEWKASIGLVSNTHAVRSCRITNNDG